MFLIIDECSFIYSCRHFSEPVNIASHINFGTSKGSVSDVYSSVIDIKHRAACAKQVCRLLVFGLIQAKVIIRSDSALE